MQIQIPEYLLVSVLRHYETLSRISVPSSDLRAVNAKRVAAKEIQKVRRLIQTRKYND